MNELFFASQLIREHNNLPCLSMNPFVLQIVETLFNALNQNLVQFELKPGVQVIVYVTQLTLGECLLGIRGYEDYFDQKREGIISKTFSIDDAIPKPICMKMANSILVGTTGRLSYKLLYY